MGVKEFYKRGMAGWFNILYPRRCPLCLDILEDERRQACPACERAARPIQGPRCFMCSAPVVDGEEYCGACRKHPHVFDAQVSVFAYSDMWKASLERYKFHGAREFAPFYARCMARNAWPYIRRWQPDLMLPIPLHKKKERERGFNQSALLCREMSGLLEIPFKEGCLVKTRATRAQKKLDARERRENLKGAFSVTERLDGGRILLIDDVFTTGSTLDAAAACLKENGASAVFALTLCMAMQ